MYRSTIKKSVVDRVAQSCYIGTNKPKAEQIMHHRLTAQVNYYYSFIYFSVDRAILGFAGKCEMRKCFG
jgi:hypothetical protein